VGVVRRLAVAPLLLLAACGGPRQQAGGPAIWDNKERPARAESVEERHRRAAASGDAAVSWLTADLLAKRRPAEASWKDARAAAAKELAPSLPSDAFDPAAVRDELDGRLRRARAELAEASKIARSEAKDFNAVEKDVKELDRLAARLQFAAVHSTLLAEEKERLSKRAEEEFDEELSYEAERLGRKIRNWETERAELTARKKAVEERLARVRETGDGRAAAAARLEKAREAEREARQDLALLSEWARTPAAAAAAPRPAASDGPAARRLRAPEKREIAFSPPPEAEFYGEEPAEPPPARPPARRASAPARPEGQAAVLYQVQRGDTLPSVAAKHYGDAGRWRDIYSVNAHQIRRGLLQPGQWILVPM
jgi:nucleoid-associated protein YgaU